ncbi:fluoride efflux transporter FluC [Leucobacter chironomi]|uniref:fluoride efflux transporter FluC n=1 Tax=Leucobacter chironomi TaxID=491918 RepID=UPI00041807E5|nr:CrcB family protein [Leucobacter chironomi]
MRDERNRPEADARPRFAALLPDLAVVAVGGALGSLARYLLSIWIGPSGDFPLAVFAANVAGAFLLGLLVELVTRAGGDGGRWRTVRLLLGTGVLGGFTTYSMLAADIAELLLGGAFGVAALYALLTLVLGGAASWCGVLAGRIPGRVRVRGAER